MVFKWFSIVPALVLVVAVAGCPGGGGGDEGSGEDIAAKELSVRLAGGDAKAVGSTVTYEVVVDGGPSDIQAFGLDVGFDAGQLAYIGWERGDLTAGFTQLGANGITDNLVRVGGFTVDAPVSAGSKGALVTLEFEVVSQAPTTLRVSSNVDDIEAYTTN